MKYLKRILFCVALPLALMVYPFEMAIRYIITGEECHEKTFAFKLINNETDRK